MVAGPGPATGAAVLFPAVDRALFVAAFVERLRGVGLDPATIGMQRFARALEVADPRTPGELYWVARSCLVDDVTQLEAFDRVFTAVFGADRASGPPTARREPLVLPSGPERGDDRYVRVPSAQARLPGGGAVPWVTPPSAAGEEAGDEPSGTVLPELRPTDRERLADVPFDHLDEEDLARIGAWLEEAVARWPQRRARRVRRSARGRVVDRRRTMHAALRTAGEPLVLARVERVRRPRRVVVLADVSGSMRSYTRAYLHLMRGLGRAADAETFAFATRLTRLTPMLRHTDPRVAIDRATAEVVDRFGGTRVATSLRTLLHHPVWGTAVRGAVVVVASDGWDGDPPELLDAQMRRLARMAERVVWVNPRVAAPGFAPSTAGMAAALPHCDRLVSGHSLTAMHELVAALVDR